MEERRPYLINSCSFVGIKPIMMELPYPAIQVWGRNQAYADLLSVDYCGAVSEMSAIAQYINNENRLSCDNCPYAKVLLGIAMAEMMHLQKLGELIDLLGGSICFEARQCGRKPQMWTPEYLTLPEDAEKMIMADIEAERAAIGQYRAHMAMIKDPCVNAVLERIIKDEEYHIMTLQTLREM